MWDDRKDQNRWKMKFILPEHNEALRQLHLSKKKKIEQPILSPEQLEEFEYTIATAMREDMPLNFELFDNGFSREISGGELYTWTT
ncbi:hypothetical protein BsIDN1_54230 [Bacillus safensis]|uniref:YolD-like family protein n=1 Tax=Bacillus safensis TaxID=561879 RepID=A0A5S9MGA6_BACIA|nr:hypothetical protein BsIDN1_54230 [Bacillus safensis]